MNETLLHEVPLCLDEKLIALLSDLWKVDDLLTETPEQDLQQIVEEWPFKFHCTGKTLCGNSRVGAHGEVFSFSFSPGSPLPTALVPLTLAMSTPLGGHAMHSQLIP
jgi:hypothetical protein